MFKVEFKYFVLFTSLFLANQYTFAKSGFSSVVRVKIGSRLKSVTIKGTDMKRYLYVSDDLKIYSGTKRVRFVCKRPKNNKKKIIKKLAQIKSQTGLLTWNKRRYRGELLVLSNLRGGCDLVNIVPIESYISTLLSKEMNGSWNLEALKAQAIVARTYAIQKIRSKHTSRKIKMEAFYDIENSEKHQVSGSFFDATKLTYEATKATKGKILVTKKKGLIVPTFYHAKCGGRTILPQQVWGNKVAGYRSVKCNHCSVSGQKKWKKSITEKQFKKFVNWLVKKGYVGKKTPIEKLDKIMMYIPSDNLMKIKLGVYLDEHLLLFNKSLFRRYFGKKLFPSNRFKVVMLEDMLNFYGEGLGHGVGMCQIGALYMAKKGSRAKDILKFYFPQHKIRRIY